MIRENFEAQSGIIVASKKAKQKREFLRKLSGGEKKKADDCKKLLNVQRITKQKTNR